MELPCSLSPKANREKGKQRTGEDPCPIKVGSGTGQAGSGPPYTSVYTKAPDPQATATTNTPLEDNGR